MAAAVTSNTGRGRQTCRFLNCNMVFQSSPDLFEHICVHLEDKIGSAQVVESFRNGSEHSVEDRYSLDGMIQPEILSSPCSNSNSSSGGSSSSSSDSSAMATGLRDETEENFLGVGYDSLVPLLDIILDRFTCEENDMIPTAPPVKVTEILPPIDSFSQSQINTQAVESGPLWPDVTEKIDWNSLLENFPSAADSIDSFSDSITVDDIFPKNNSTFNSSSNLDSTSQVLSLRSHNISINNSAEDYQSHHHKDGRMYYHRHHHPGKGKGRFMEKTSTTTTMKKLCCGPGIGKLAFADMDDPLEQPHRLELSSESPSGTSTSSSSGGKGVHFNQQGASRVTFVTSSKRTIHRSGASTPKSRTANRKTNMFNTETGEYYTPEFILKEGLKKKRGHLNSIQKPYVCPVPGCGKAYKNPNGIKYHAKYGHSAPQEFPCHCGKMYSTRHGLMAHKKVHNGPEGNPAKTVLSKMKVKKLSAGSMSGSESDESCSSKNCKSSSSSSSQSDDESSDCEEYEECRHCIGCGLK